MLTGKQRSKLKSMAMNLPDAVYIGKSDLTDAIIKEMNDYLEAHELLKVKLQESCLADPKEMANKCAQQLGADFVQAIGRKFVLYRESEKHLISLK